MAINLNAAAQQLTEQLAELQAMRKMMDTMPDSASRASAAGASIAGLLRLTMTNTEILVALLDERNNTGPS